LNKVSTEYFLSMSRLFLLWT